MLYYAVRYSSKTCPVLERDRRAYEDASGRSERAKIGLSEGARGHTVGVKHRPVSSGLDTIRESSLCLELDSFNRQLAGIQEPLPGRGHAVSSENFFSSFSIRYPNLQYSATLYLGWSALRAGPSLVFFFL